MKCTKCGKPDAVRDRKAVFMGNVHWTAFCSAECKSSFYEGRRAYAETAAKNDPFRKAG
jgi:hypothetical protein